MDLGFETIGNATLVCHDGGPVLATDPWIVGSAYFGSWTRSHEIPEEQMQAIRACPYVWLSHGHPDHLSAESLALLKDREILIPDHVGRRIERDLARDGFKLRVLEDRQWVELSPRVRVACVADYNQDAILLVDVGGRLVVNLNDAGDRGWGVFVRNTIRRYPESYLLCLSGFGDADMINYFDEDGRRIPPVAAAKVPVGQGIARRADYWGVRYFIPFSSMHRYQRADSLWASAYTTHLSDYGKGFHSKRCELLPAYARVDLAHEWVEPIRPPESPRVVHEPAEFGDHWDEPLEPGDLEEIERYFRAVEHLETAFDFIQFRVAGRDHRIELRTRKLRRGITFEAPRGSLMTAVRYQVFDDLLIGNFMKTTVHGDPRPEALYPDFSPWVCKYADNGGVRTRTELSRYFRAYALRDPLGYLRSQLDSRCVRPIQEGAARVLRRTLGGNSMAFRAAREAFWTVRRAM
jgi:L-ascorbate metabolism protein UlaG (beta-lactamase superfamily)